MRTVTCFLVLLLLSAGPSRAVETVMIESDGWQLFGSFYLPEEGKKVVPAALLLHQAAGTRQEYEALAEQLVIRGMAVLALDLRGHGESVNKGRYEPPYAENRHINQEAYRDIKVALVWLKQHPRIDSGHLAVVGSSYSGEQVALAYRDGMIASVYVMLSPGNFSEESVRMLDDSPATWLLVRSVNESPVSKPFIDDVFARLNTDAPETEQWILPGNGHAAGLFRGRPDFPGRLAHWIAQVLSAGTSIE